jgi:K+/H+ antiporter YhaU regulatory subunit KhtT
MRKLKVRHQPLPHVGELFELITASGDVVTIVTHRSTGRRELVVRRPGADEPLSNTGLTRTESAAIAALLVGAHIELCTTEQL